MVWGTCYKGAKPEVIVLLKSRISLTKCTETLATNLREKSPLYAGQCRINPACNVKRSPDLNPIENVWQHIKQLRSNDHVHSLNELWTKIN